MAAAATSSVSGVTSITVRSGNETKSATCGPIGVCRLNPSATKRRSPVIMIHNARSASVGLRRSSRARPRTGASFFAISPLPCWASRLRSMSASAPSSRPPRAGPLRPSTRAIITPCSVRISCWVGCMRVKILRMLTIIVPRFSCGRKNSIRSSSRSRSPKKASNCSFGAGGDFSGAANGSVPALCSLNHS